MQCLYAACPRQMPLMAMDMDCTACLCSVCHHPSFLLPERSHRGTPGSARSLIYWPGMLLDLQSFTFLKVVTNPPYQRRTCYDNNETNQQPGQCNIRHIIERRCGNRREIAIERVAQDEDRRNRDHPLPRPDTTSSEEADRANVRQNIGH